MATPSLASIIPTASKASTSKAPNVASSEEGKSVLNKETDELKQPPSSQSLKRNKSTLQRCHKPLEKNPFTTYRDPVTGQWMVKRYSKHC